jgi:hypothetical protein
MWEMIRWLAARAAGGAIMKMVAWAVSTATAKIAQIIFALNVSAATRVVIVQTAATARSLSA